MFFEYIKSALSSIKNNKGRSFLTMLGIIIGITAVLIVLVIGDGMKAKINGEINSIGATTFSIKLDTNKTDKYFTKNIIDTVQDGVDNIYGISPSMNVFGTVTHGAKTYDLFLSGGSEALEKAGVTMVHGRYFSRDDVDEEKKVIVISQSTAKNLFGYEEVVGETIDITSDNYTATFTVVGVRKDNSQDTAFASFGMDATLLGDIPYTSAASAFNINIDSNFTSVTVYLDSAYKDSAMKAAKTITENVMGERGNNCVTISTGTSFDKTTNSILDIVTTVVAIIAAISLLVGGIGVMNIMTVSVTERTREIGIRKSLGARTSSILTQFLAEAAILTFTGGVIGILLGLGIAYIICKIIGFSFVVNPILVLVVVGISTAIGLFFGIYPARRAAKLDPIEALRSE